MPLGQECPRELAGSLASSAPPGTVVLSGHRLPTADPAVVPLQMLCPNCDEGLGSIFSVLILYFPFPLFNIKHNFALSLSLRLRFADVSAWKHDPVLLLLLLLQHAGLPLPLFCPSPPPPAAAGCGGVCTHSSGGRKSRCQNPTTGPHPFSVSAGASGGLMCLWLLTCLFNNIPVCLSV